MEDCRIVLQECWRRTMAGGGAGRGRVSFASGAVRSGNAFQSQKKSDPMPPCPLLLREPIIKDSMSVIEIRGLAKSYRVYQKKEGLWAAFTGLFHRQYRDVHAVRGIDLDVQQGEFVAF